MGWEQLHQHTRQRQQMLDDSIAALWQQCRQTAIPLHCRQGCAGCCTLAVNCSFPEAALLAETLTCDQQRQVIGRLPMLAQLCATASDLKHFLRLYRDTAGACPFLDRQQNCTVYAQRPLSCRALLSTRPAGWCAVDFAQLHPHEKQAFLSSLDPAVVAYPSHYLAASQTQGAGLEVDLGNALEQRFGLRLSGNLLWLIGLELNHRLSERLQRDGAKLKDWLGDQQRQHPYLLLLA